ncbi:MAG TPA: glycosyltransferase family 2 protein [Anaerolineales bacterium]|nr:glycosyltransferase family 2 protein [Anaerolineales bacterium]
MQPLVSIVTPSYNQAKYLEQTIQSVLGQDYAQIEYLVVDGGSTDGSVEIIKKYAIPLESGSLLPDKQKQVSPSRASRDHGDASALQSSIDWWLSEKDSGQGEAINKGLGRANGEILAWLNSDDYYLPGTFSAMVKVFEENPDVVMVYGDMLAVDERGQTMNALKYKQLSLQDLLCFQIIGQPSVFFRRDVLKETGGLDTTFHFLLDHHLWIRIAQRGRILHVSQTWAAARYHAEAKNRARAAEFGREAFRILDWAKTQPGLAEAVSGVERRARASANRVDARYLLDGGQPWSALKAWTRALFIHPPTALARLNILVSALLHLSGLRVLREYILRTRRRRISGNE